VLVLESLLKSGQVPGSGPCVRGSVGPCVRGSVGPWAWPVDYSDISDYSTTTYSETLLYSYYIILFLR